MRRCIRDLCMAMGVLVSFLPAEAWAEERFSDDFRSLGNLRVVERVVQRRDFPRIVTRPDRSRRSACQETQHVRVRLRR